MMLTLRLLKNQIKLKNIVIMLFLAFMVICPIWIDPTRSLGHRSLRIYQEQLFQVGITIFFVLFFVKNIYLSLFFIWATILYIYNNFPDFSGSMVLTIFSGIIAFQIAYNITNMRIWDLIKKTLLLLLFIDISFSVLQLIGKDFLYFQYSTREQNIDFVGFFGIKAHHAIFIALMTPFLVEKVGNLGFLTLPLIARCESSTSFAIICAYFVIKNLSFLKSHKKLLITAIICSLLVGGAYTIKDSKQNFMTDRFSVWKISIQDALKKPITGWGVNSYREVWSEKKFMYFKNTRTNESKALEYSPKEKSFIAEAPFARKGDVLDPWGDPHNEYVHLLFEFGIIGLIIFLLMVRDFSNRMKQISTGVLRQRMFVIEEYFFILLLVAITHFPLHVIRLGYLPPILLGVFYKLTDVEKEIF